MTHKTFRIATCKPAETLERAEKLRMLVGSPDAVVAPFFRKTIRVGPLRRKRTAESVVLSGLIFVAEDAADAARGSGGICACRSDAAASGGVVQMLTPWKDPTTGDRDYARASAGELAPLIEFAAERDAAFVGKAEADAARRVAKATGLEIKAPRIEVDTRGWVGKRAALGGGLFAGSKGIVKAVIDGEAVVDLDAGGWVSTITVPVELVQVEM